MKLAQNALGHPRNLDLHRKYVGPVVSRFIAITACALGLLLAGCGIWPARPSAQSPSESISVTPNRMSLRAGNSQQFVATVSNAPSRAVVWTVSPASPQLQAGASNAVGTISPAGLYTAPANLSNQIDVQVTATSSANSSIKASATVTVTPPATITVSPETVSMTANTTQVFTASLSDSNLGPVQWFVDGAAGGSPSTGTITPSGSYTAPEVAPGKPVTIQAVSSTSNGVTGTATVTIANPPPQAMAGITYAKLLSSWNDTQLLWIEELSGLQWDATGRAWSPVSGWTAPSNGIGPQIFYLYTALDPITEMAIAKQDISLMEELALFHVALLEQRTTTIGTMERMAPPDAYIFIDGAPSDRTFNFETPYAASRIEITECQLCDSRYLLSAARLMRAIAELSPDRRTAPLTNSVSGFSSFIANQQLIRLLYGTTPWSHWNNPNIPQPLVSRWTFLAQTGYEPPHPIKYQAAMTDAELWILADAAEMLGADAEAPDLAILDDDSRTQLVNAVVAGTSLLQNRSQHLIAPDGAGTLSTLAGDYDDHPDLAYSAYEGQTIPTIPDSKYGLMADAQHSSILPPVFQSLYENRDATGATFPALADVVSLANTLVHLAFNGNSQFPDFNNYIDGWNGWFRVGYSDIPGGYPPHQYCNSQLDPNNCMTAGTLQGWAHLAIYNPDLAALEQDLISLANDDSPAATTFKTQHYFYNGPYTTNARDYPDILIYIGGDASRLVQ